tara:strand:+ start:89 stop:394 length:306 start_codon:yes stop_codon:yes gene_type:complete
MKSKKIMFLIHKYGIYYSLSLYVLLLAHIGIYITSLNFWLLLFCFCLNVYFVFHKGMVYALSRQDEFKRFQDKLLNKLAVKTMKEIEEEQKKEEEENNRLN